MSNSSSEASSEEEPEIEKGRKGGLVRHTVVGTTHAKFTALTLLVYL